MSNVKNFIYDNNLQLQASFSDKTFDEIKALQSEEGKTLSGAV